MSSQFSTLMQSAGFPQLIEQLGEPVTHYANGTGSGTSVTAIVVDMDDGGMELQQGHAVEVVRIKKLQIASSVSVGYTDQWVIEGNRWETVSNPDAHDGFRVVTVRRVDQSKQRRSKPVGA